MRIGHGFDVHQLGENRPLILGGVTINHPYGLVAHSDGDVVLHAVIDALLGAAALGDIGQHFPDTDMKYKNVNSRFLLKQSYQFIQKKGFTLLNLDITILAQQPKLSSYILAMRKNIAEDLQADVTAINVKATTTEKLGFVGREEGIACEAVTLLRCDFS